MASGELSHLPAEERELLGIVARKLTTEGPQRITPEQVWENCKGKQLLVSISARVVDKTVLESVFEGLRISASGRQALLSYFADFDPPYVVSRLRDTPSEEEEIVAKGSAWDRKWRNAFITAGLILIAVIIAAGATHWYRTLPPAEQAKKPATPPQTPAKLMVQTPATPLTSTPIPVTGPAINTPTIGQRMHVAEDNIAKLQTDGKIFNQRIERLKHERLGPLEATVVEHGPRRKAQTTTRRTPIPRRNSHSIIVYERRKQ